MSGPEVLADTLRCGAATDVGLVREANEDAHLAAAPVFVVADGMGGHDAGDVASGYVIEEFTGFATEGLVDPEAVAAAIEERLRAVCDRIAAFDAEQHAAGSPDFSAGTTAALAVATGSGEDARWVVANVGDSRVYCLDEDGLVQVTTDHSLVQELVDEGRIRADEASLHPARNVVTRALGVSAMDQPDFFSLPMRPGQRLLLCTDGVNGLIDDVVIADVLATWSDPYLAAERLVAAALEAGGHDNATAVVVDVVGWAHGPTDDHDLNVDSDTARRGPQEKRGARP